VSGPGCTASESFNAEEMKILATEYFGSYGRAKRVWTLKGWYDTAAFTRPEDAAMAVMTARVKPGGELTKDNLLDGLEKMMDPEQAKVTLEKFLTEIGGEQNLEKRLKDDFALSGAAFFRALITYLLGDGEPLVANLRPGDTAAGPEGVWNHVVFWYAAKFQETENANDERDMSVMISLAANADIAPDGDPPTRPEEKRFPSDPTSSIVVPSSDPEVCRRVVCKMRLIFDDYGIPNGGDSRTAWTNCFALPTFMDAFAPTNLDILKPVDRKRGSDVPKMTGNTALGTEFVGKGYLTVRARFR
jgi:hypothetical protein